MPVKRSTTKVQAKPNKANTIDAYLDRLPADQRAALEKLRRAIKAVVPNAVECISYQLPAFRLDGRFFVAFGAATNHCAFYPGAVLDALGVDLEKYDTSKGTIRFPADKPLPATLIRKLIKARIAANAAKKKKAAGRAKGASAKRSE